MNESNLPKEDKPECLSLTELFQEYEATSPYLGLDGRIIFKDKPEPKAD